MNALTVFKASAGSGKTFTLAIQYIKLLVLASEGGEYARILAVTFTNKATTEMKDRILCQLYGIGQGLPSSNDYYEALCRSIQSDGIEVPSEEELRSRCRRALHQILHDYNRFRVQTIDAFFQSVLRGLAHELGLTANLQVEIGDKEVLSKAVDRIFDRLQDDEVLLDWVMSLVEDQIMNNQRWDVTNSVKAFGSTIFNEDYLMRGDKLRALLTDDKALRQVISQISQLQNQARSAAIQLGNELAGTLASLSVDYTDFSNGSDLGKLASKLQAGDMTINISNRIHKFANDPLTLVKMSDRRRRPDLIEAADQVADVLSHIVDTFDKLQYTYNSAYQTQAHIKLLRLLADIDREVTSINSETSRFNLAKTPILLRRMIGESDAPFIFEKIGAQLKNVMIDEFQDTSRLQWQNFRTLLLESFAKGGSNLLVGDVKQSIYRWRGGDWHMLANIEHTVEPAPRIETLDTNYRSFRQVIEFNNEFFLAAVPELDNVSAAEVALIDEPFSFASAYADVKQKIPANRTSSGFVRISVQSAKEFESREAREAAVINDMMQQIRLLHDSGLPYDKMTILVRFKDEAKTIIEAFSKVNDMPSIVSDEAFYYSSSSAVVALITALRLLDTPNDPVATYYLMNLCLEVMPLDEQLKELPLYDLLETLYQRLNLDQIPGQDTYVMGFFDAVMDFVHQETSDIRSFLRYWDEKLNQESIPAGQVDGIRIITIHKSKGLEFHTVLMPFCTWDFDSDRRAKHKSFIWCTPDEEPYAQLQLVPVTLSKMSTNSIFASPYAREHLYKRLDEFNALYVGFTRARCNLYAWAVGDGDNLQNPTRTVGDLLAKIYPNGHERGLPVSHAKAEKSTDDNRLIPHRKPTDVTMCSYPLTATFRQSNQSKLFVAQPDNELDDFSLSISSQEQQYIEIGRLLHSVLQQIETTADIPHVLDALEREGIISRRQADGSYISVRRNDLEGWLQKGLEQPTVSTWFNGEWHLFTECSIASIDTISHQPMVKRPDRVMVSADERRVVVVDFKFGRPHKDYEGQVLEYISLLKQMYPNAAVEGYLWYVYSAKVQPVLSKRATSSRGRSEIDNNQLTLDF